MAICQSKRASNCHYVGDYHIRNITGYNMSSAVNETLEVYSVIVVKPLTRNDTILSIVHIACTHYVPVRHYNPS